MSSKSNSSSLIGYSAAAAFSLVGYLVAKKAWKKYNGIDGIATPTELQAIISKRRTINPMEYDQQRVVSKEIVEEMLSSANWAPTHGKTEPWRFIVLSGKALERLGELDGKLYTSTTTPETFKKKKFEKKSIGKTRCSYVIAICMKRQESEQIPEIEEIQAVACAVQNMHLVATSYGVGCYWGSGPTIHMKEMRDFLGLQGKDLCLGLFHVGYPTKPHPKGQRRNVSEKIQWRTN